MRGGSISDSLVRVLLVDDEPDIRLVLRLGLEVAGLEVAVAGSAEEALAVAASFAPQLILLDVEMPGVDGPSALQLLRRQPWGSDVAVAFLTASADSAAVEALRQLDVIEVLTKPVDPLRLGARLRELWRRQGEGRRPGGGGEGRAGAPP